MSGLKLQTPSGGSVQLTPTDTASHVVLTLPSSTTNLVGASDLVASSVRYTPVGAAPTDVQSKLREFSSCMDYFLAAEANASAMFTRAGIAARRVLIPAGNYVAGDVNFPANTEFFGEGEDVTIITQLVGTTSIFRNDSGSPLVINNLRNCKINNLQLRGQVDTLGFSEHVHLLSLNGVSDLTVKYVKFKGFRGDGLYLGSSNTAATERHNVNVMIKRCTFDGINNDNRNGISVIDVDGIDIDGNKFINCTRSNMPGAIDFEPNADAFPIIKNIKVRNNTFENIGGNVGDIGFILPVTITAETTNVRVENNTSKTNVGTGAFFSFSANKKPTASSMDNDIVISGNSVRNGSIPFSIPAGKSIVLRDNTFTDFSYPGLLGYTTALAFVRDMVLVNNTLTRCGSVAGNGLEIFNSDYLTLDFNKFKDCGTGVGGASNAINFNTGTSSNVKLTHNEFSSATGKTLISIQKEATHTFTPSTNVFIGNTLSGLPHNFQAEESDAFDTAYTPVVAGDGTAGAGVYTGGRVGRFRRIGKTVFFRAEVNVSAGHTGAGGILVSLPYPCVDLGNGEQTPVALSVTGVSSTGGQVGLIHPYVTVGGAGCVRIFQTATGVRGSIAIPAGAFTINVSGSYITT